jgi:protein required for attachment to host cells
MQKTWILVTDARRARCFERHGADLLLTELADFVYPHARLASVAGDGGDLTGAAGKGHGRTGHAGTQFEPHTDVAAKERSSFASQLAAYLNEGTAQHKCDALALIATSPMMGEIKSTLSPAADKLLKRCVVSDLTHYKGPELEERIHHALELPD